MTSKQRITLFIDIPKRHHVSLWTRVCQAHGWDKDDRALRIHKFSEAVGRSIKKTSELDNKDIDRVFAYLRAGLDNLAAARELDHPEMGDARRLRWKVEEVKSELAAFVDHVPAYVEEIIRDKFNHGRSNRVGVLTEDELTPDQLRQLLITLTSRLKEFKLAPEPVSDDPF